MGVSTQPVLKIRLVASSRPENGFFLCVIFDKPNIFSVILCQQQTTVSILECHHIFQVCVIFEKPNIFSVIFCQLQTTVCIVECHLLDSTDTIGMVALLLFANS